MAVISEDTIQKIKKIVEPYIGKSLADISQEIGVPFYEVDLESVIKDKVSGVIMYSKKNEKFSIFLEKKISQARKRFTLAHEIGHYFLHKDVMFSGNYLFVDTDEIYAFFRPNEWNNMSEEYKQYEREANRFAAELLMPEDVIRKAYVELGYNIKALAELFFVSEQAVTYRLINLSLLTN